MPRIDSSAWSVKYDDPRSGTRFLLSLPEAMLMDLHVLAHSQGISVAEVLRRAVTRALAEHTKDCDFQCTL